MSEYIIKVRIYCNVAALLVWALVYGIYDICARKAVAR